MAYRGDNSQSALTVLVDTVASPVVADVQAVKLISGVAGDGTPVPADSAGALSIKERRPTVATHSNVNGNAASVALLAANPARLAAAIFNDSTATLYISLNGNASATNYLVQIGAGQYFELPFGWTGLINGIWSAANGAARITEFS